MLLRKTHDSALFGTAGPSRRLRSHRASRLGPDQGPSSSTSCVERCSVSVRSELPPSLIPPLPGRPSTHPSVFEQEQARIFEAYWFAAARTSDLEGPGSFETVEVGRENVLIVRGRDRKLRA